MCYAVSIRRANRVGVRFFTIEYRPVTQTLMILNIRPDGENYNVTRAHATGSDMIRQGRMRADLGLLSQLQRIGDRAELVSLKSAQRQCGGTCDLCLVRNARTFDTLAVSRFASDDTLRYISCCDRCHLGSLRQVLVAGCMYITDFEDGSPDIRCSIFSMDHERPTRRFTTPTPSYDKTRLHITAVRSSPGGGAYSSLLDMSSADKAKVYLCDLQSPRPEYSFVYSGPVLGLSMPASVSVCMRDNQTCCVTADRLVEMVDLRSLSVTTTLESKFISHFAQTAFVSENISVILSMNSSEAAYDIRYPPTPIYVVMCPYGYQIV